MKRLALSIALALPQVVGAQSDPFMDLTMPSVDAPMETTVHERKVRGCTVPERPEWTVSFPPKERQKGTLLRLMHERLWLSKVTESGSCSCENRWPAWDETEVAFNLYMKDLDISGMTALYHSISKGNDALAVAANNICAEEKS